MFLVKEIRGYQPWSLTYSAKVLQSEQRARPENPRFSHSLELKTSLDDDANGTTTRKHIHIHDNKFPYIFPAISFPLSLSLQNSHPPKESAEMTMMKTQRRTLACMESGRVGLGLGIGPIKGPSIFHGCMAIGLKIKIYKQP